MSGIGLNDVAAKVQGFVTAFASAPSPEDTPFVRNSRPFAIYMGIIALAAMGVMTVYYKDPVTTVAVAGAISLIVQQFGAQRSKDNQAKIAAATEDKKTVTAAAATTQVDVQ